MGVKQINKTVANRLREVIEEKGIDIKELAASLGISQSYAYQILKAERSVSPEILRGLKEKYKINLNYLFSTEREKYREPKFLDEKRGCKTYMIGDKLKEIRTRLNLTRRELYSKLCLIRTEAEYIEIEENKKEADEAIIYEICAKFKIDLDYFLK